MNPTVTCVVKWNQNDYLLGNPHRLLCLEYELLRTWVVLVLAIKNSTLRTVPSVPPHTNSELLNTHFGIDHCQLLLAVHTPFQTNHTQASVHAHAQVERIMYLQQKADSFTQAWRWVNFQCVVVHLYVKFCHKSEYQRPFVGRHRHSESFGNTYVLLYTKIFQ